MDDSSRVEFFDSRDSVHFISDPVNPGTILLQHPKKNIKPKKKSRCCCPSFCTIFICVAFVLSIAIIFALVKTQNDSYEMSNLKWDLNDLKYRFDTFDSQFQRVETFKQHVDEEVDNFNDKISNLDDKFDKLSKKYQYVVDSTLIDVKKQLSDLTKKFDQFSKIEDDEGRKQHSSDCKLEKSLRARPQMKTIIGVDENNDNIDWVHMLFAKNERLWNGTNFNFGVAPYIGSSYSTDKKFVQHMDVFGIIEVQLRIPVYSFDDSLDPELHFRTIKGQLENANFVRGKDFVGVSFDACLNRFDSKETISEKLVALIKMLDEWTGQKTVIKTGRCRIFLEQFEFFTDEQANFMKRHPLWVRDQYSKLAPDVPAPWDGWLIWEYETVEKVEGINGYVSMSRVKNFNE